MNKLGYLLAFAAGAAAGYFIAKNKFEQDLTDYIMNNPHQTSPVEVSEMDPADTNNSSDEGNKPVSVNVLEEIKSSPADKIAYNKLMGKVSTPDDIIALNDYKDNLSSKNFRKPEKISEDDFGMLDDYKTLTLEWYALDDTLMEFAGDDLTTKIETLVGLENLPKLEEFVDEEDLIYVRNYEYKIDFEIICKQIGYYVEVEDPEALQPRTPETEVLRLMEEEAEDAKELEMLEEYEDAYGD